MAGHRFFLRLPDGDVTAALEIMRRLLDPRSTALPHVTVRYNSPKMTRSVDHLYLGAAVPEVDILGVGTFDVFGSTADRLAILVLRCEVEALEWLHYKPRYADTFFHITLYDGEPSALAAAALDRLSRMPWRFRVAGEGRIVSRSPHSDRDTDGKPRLSRAAERMYSRVFGCEGTDLAKLTEGERLDRLVILADSMHRSSQVEDMEGDHPARAGEIVHSASPVFVQEGFWSEMELPGVGDPRVESAQRRATGTVLTPPELAIEVAREALKALPEGLDIRFADPAIGTGMLFAATRHAAGAARISRAVGYERDEERGRATAYRWRRWGLEVQTGDFIGRDLTATEQFNLVLANPPYLRYEMQDREVVEAAARRIARAVGVEIPTRANLFVHFVLAAHSLMAPEAAAGWILPADFMSATYARGLRHYFAEKVTLLRVHLYDTNEMVFDNARITPAVVVFRNSPPSSRGSVMFTYGGTPEAPGRRLLVARSDLAEGRSWGPLPAAHSKPRVRSTTIGDYFVVRRGLATGGNAFFVISDEKREALGAPDPWVVPVLPKSRFLSGAVIRSDEAGVPLGIPLQWLIDSDMTVEDVRPSNPKFAAYLDGVAEAVRGGTIVSRRRHVFKQEAARPAPFLCIAMARLSAEDAFAAGNRRFLWNTSSAIALNNYHTLEPRGDLAEALESGSVGHWEILEALRGVGESELVRFGRLHSAGLLKLEPGDVRSIPFSLKVDATA